MVRSDSIFQDFKDLGLVDAERLIAFFMIYDEVLEAHGQTLSFDFEPLVNMDREQLTILIENTSTTDLKNLVSCIRLQIAQKEQMIVRENWDQVVKIVTAPAMLVESPGKPEDLYEGGWDSYLFMQ